MKEHMTKCLSHGQSQCFIAATPLPRAMEYETTFKWRNSKRKISTSKGLLYDVCLGICKQVWFAPQKSWRTWTSFRQTLKNYPLSTKIIRRSQMHSSTLGKQLLTAQITEQDWKHGCIRNKGAITRLFSELNMRLMASPKFSRQQRRYTRQWNMRLPSDGLSPRKSSLSVEILNVRRLNLWRLLWNMQTL